MTISRNGVAEVDLSLCTECGWHVRNPTEYHPWAACAIVKETRKLTGKTVDPLPYFHDIVKDMANVDDEGRWHDLDTRLRKRGQS